MNLASVGACPECAGLILEDMRRGERFCVECGLITEAGIVVSYKIEATRRINRVQQIRIAHGQKVGGPQKQITTHEETMLRCLREQRGWGYKRLAAALNFVRGPAAEHVSGHTVARRLGRGDGRNTYPRYPLGTGRGPFASRVRGAMKRHAMRQPGEMHVDSRGHAPGEEGVDSSGGSP